MLYFNTYLISQFSPSFLHKNSNVNPNLTSPWKGLSKCGLGTLEYWKDYKNWVNKIIFFLLLSKCWIFTPDNSQFSPAFLHENSIYTPFSTSQWEGLSKHCLKKFEFWKDLKNLLKGYFLLFHPNVGFYI